MELHSEPAYDTEKVTFLDFAYLGTVQSLVLRDEDVVEHIEDTPFPHIRITMARPGNPDGPEIIRLYKAHLLFSMERPGTIKKKLVKTGQSASRLETRSTAPLRDEVSHSGRDD